MGMHRLPVENGYMMCEGAVSLQVLPLCCTSNHNQFDDVTTLQFPSFVTLSQSNSIFRHVDIVHRHCVEERRKTSSSKI